MKGYDASLVNYVNSLSSKTFGYELSTALPVLQGAQLLSLGLFSHLGALAGEAVCAGPQRHSISLQEVEAAYDGSEIDGIPP